MVDANRPGMDGYACVGGRSIREWRRVIRERMLAIRKRIRALTTRSGAIRPGAGSIGMCFIEAGRRPGASMRAGTLAERQYKLPKNRKKVTIAPSGSPRCPFCGWLCL
jgi:hypothetical protein